MRWNQPIERKEFKRPLNVVLHTSLSLPMRWEKTERCDPLPVTAFIKIEKVFEMVKTEDTEAITEGVSPCNLPTFLRSFICNICLYFVSTFNNN
jgi:hypothetical protein